MTETLYPQTSNSDAKDVNVDILLSGGFNYAVSMKSDGQLLRSLLGALLARTRGKQESFLFQVPLEDGKASLCFSSDHLAGIVTDPPILMKQQEEATAGRA